TSATAATSPVPRSRSGCGSSASRKRKNARRGNGGKNRAGHKGGRGRLTRGCQSTANPFSPSPCSRRDQRACRQLDAEHTRLLGVALAAHPKGLAVGLPARLRQTQDCLPEGDSRKQAALRLGLSRHTVHERVTDLYRRFGVNSRAELLARCLRRKRK